MNKRGFTLIELLVVIAIIALLSSVVLASLSSARAKARDARRAADMDQIVTAVHMYADQFGCLPYTGGGSACLTGTTTYTESNAGTWDYSSQTGSLGSGGVPYTPVSDPNFMKFLADSGYMTKVPVDPINNMPNDSVSGYAYQYYCYNQAGKYGVFLAYWKEFPTRTQVPVLSWSANQSDQNFTCK